MFRVEASRRNRILGRIGLVGAAVLLGLLATEGIARLAWPEPAKSDLAATPDLPILDDFWDLLKPNVRGINRGVPYRTNGRGLRGPAWRPEPKPGVFRIAVAGDSTTMGSGVEEQDRYSDQLERLLNAQGSPWRYETINTGLSGLNIEQGVKRLERMLAHYRASLLVFGVSPNDIEGEHFQKLEGGEQMADWWLWAQRHSDSRSYFWRLLTFRVVDYATRENRLMRYREIRHNYLDNPDAWRDFAAGLERFAALARQHDVCGHVLLHPFLGSLGPEHPYIEVYDRVEAAARERKLTVTPTFERFKGMTPEPLWVSLFDPHPNRDGHRILAEALHAGLKQLPARCWKWASPWL